MMCVLVRKKDEQYSDKLLKREELFLSWDLYNCWKVAFFLSEQIEKYAINSTNYKNAQNLVRLKQELSN